MPAFWPENDLPINVTATRQAQQLQRVDQQQHILYTYYLNNVQPPCPLGSAEQVNVDTAVATFYVNSTVDAEPNLTYACVNSETDEDKNILILTIEVCEFLVLGPSDSLGTEPRLRPDTLQNPYNHALDLSAR